MCRTARITLLMVAMLVSLQPRTWATGKATDETDRIQSSLAVLHDLTTSPDKAIPRELLENAQAIVVIPSLVKGGFIVGAKHGRGVMSVREANGRAWSSPAFVTMTGGSIGWQIGVESVDLVLLVMNRKGVDDLMADRFTLGGNASLAAGPVGRTGDAATDAKLSSQILAYSRTSGLFAGATLEGAALRGDKDSNKAFYGRPMAVTAIVSPAERNANAPSIAETWRETLRRLAFPDDEKRAKLGE
jgi:lipid-binding SYLF domain-containing protein